MVDRFVLAFSLVRKILLALFLVCSPNRSSAQQPRVPEKYALLVAVNVYQDAYLNRPALKYPESDALAIQDELVKSGYVVEMLLGRQATREAIVAKLQKLSEKGSDSGCVVLGFFGHGVEFKSTKEIMFLPYDASRRVVTSAKGDALFESDGKNSKMTEPDPKSLVAMSETLLNLGLSQAGNKLLLVDCCRQIPNEARGTRDVGSQSASRGYRMFGESLDKQNLPYQTAAIFACSEGEVAQEDDDWKHGAMTKCLLELLPELRGESSDINSITGRLQKRVAKLVSESKSGNKRQTVHPIFNGVVELKLSVRELPRKYTSAAIGMEFVLVSPDTFWMGAPENEQGRNKSDEFLHQVSISSPLYVGKYEVMQSEFEAVMGFNPSHFDKTQIKVDSKEVTETLRSFNKNYEERRLKAIKELEDLRSQSTLIWLDGKPHDPASNKLFKQQEKALELEKQLSDVVSIQNLMSKSSPSKELLVLIASSMQDLDNEFVNLQRQQIKSLAEKITNFENNSVRTAEAELEILFRKNLGDSHPTVVAAREKWEQVRDELERRKSEALQVITFDFVNETYSARPIAEQWDKAKASLADISQKLKSKRKQLETEIKLLLVEQQKNQSTINKYTSILEDLDAVRQVALQTSEKLRKLSLGTETINSNHMPVEQVSWFDAVMFCNRLSLMDGRSPAYLISSIETEDGQQSIRSATVQMVKGTNGYRLLSEAEWEYACRAGSQSAFSFGTTISTDQANIGGKSPMVSTSFKPNHFGLCNMHGNVSEWCWDYHSKYSMEDNSDPFGPSTGWLRVVRGGSCSSSADDCRSAARLEHPPSYRAIDLGFRVCLPTVR